MQVYLIRHTPPDIDRGVCYGRSDIGLAAGFERARSAVCQKLPRAGIGKVYTSPLKRCLGLAHTLGAGSPVIDRRLLEMDFGEWELKPWRDIDRRVLDAWSEDFVTRRPPGGENLESVYHRTVAFIRDLLRQDDEAVAVVTHAGVVRCFLAYLTATPLDEVFGMEVDYGDVFLVELSQDIEYTSIEKL